MCIRDRLNIIKYKAEEVDGQPAKDAYRKYVDSFKLYIKDLGAEVIWIGDVTHTIIGSTEAPDLVFLVKWISCNTLLTWSRILNILHSPRIVICLSNMADCGHAMSRMYDKLK